MNLAYEDRGHGEAVLFIAGQGGLGRTWDLHQVPAFRAAGYRVITFDNRGVGATANTDTFSTATMVADTAELIERLGVAPARLVGVSMGSYIAQELMVCRPELVSQAVLMATRGRHDRAREFFRQAELELAGSDVRIPAAYEAKLRLLENFSPKTLNDDSSVRDWIDTFTMWPAKPTRGVRAQYDVAPDRDRRSAYRSITASVRVFVVVPNDSDLPQYVAVSVTEVASSMNRAAPSRLALALLSETVTPSGSTTRRHGPLSPVTCSGRPMRS